MINDTPLRAIRLKCLDCCCNQIVEVRECTAEGCPLWVYRMGHNPKRKGLGNYSHLCGEKTKKEPAGGENIDEDI